ELAGTAQNRKEVSPADENKGGRGPEWPAPSAFDLRCLRKARGGGQEVLRPAPEVGRRKITSSHGGTRGHIIKPRKTEKVPMKTANGPAHCKRCKRLSACKAGQNCHRNASAFGPACP